MGTPGRNDPCPCGSGHKYKKCCLRSKDEERATAHRSHDVRESAIARLLDYVSSPQFDTIHETAWNMFWGDLEELPPDELDELLEDPDSDSKFDAFFTLDFELESGGSLIDLFLDAKRSKLDLREREYLERLRGARLRLFEVLAVDPAAGVHLADLETGSGLTVQDFGAVELIQWDVIAARVTTDDRGVSTFEAGLYVYPAGAQTECVRYLKAARREFLKASPAREASFPRFRALLLHHLWLDLVVCAAPPELLTVEGDRAEPCRVIFDLHDERALRAALARRADVEHGAQTVRWIDRNLDGPGLLGVLRFETGTAVLDVLSRPRADRGRGWLEALAGSAVAFREVRSESMVAAVRRLALDEVSETAQPTRSERFREVAGDSQRQWLDTPSPALSTRTPREASRSKSLRPRVIDLLKAFENQTERDRRAGLEIAPVDWMWSELGLPRPEPTRQRTLFK
jgi:SEC-C motif